MVKRILIYGFCLAALPLFLAGCGIKPDTLTPPPGAEDRQFPRTYPDPATDPVP